MNLEHVINEALELNVIKDGDLKLPIDQVVVRNYDEVVGYAGRVRKPMIDWVTEYNYVSKESLTKEQFDKIKELLLSKDYETRHLGYKMFVSTSLYKKGKPKSLVPFLTPNDSLFNATMFLKWDILKY